MTDVNVKFGGEIDPLVQKLNAAGDAVKTTVGGMSGAIASLNSVFDGFFSKLTLVIGALAGGAAFKGFIDSANSVNSEAAKMATTLGITGEAAGVLRVALGDVYIETDEYIGLMQRFQRQLRSNEQGLKDAGLATRDSSHHLRDINTLFSEGMAIVGSYKQGIDRNTKAMEIFGSRVGDVNKYLKLTPAVMEEARKKSESLGLTITEEGLKASRAYKAAMNDVKDVTEGVSKTIGEAFTPLQTEALKGFAALGPQIVAATRIMIDAFLMAKDKLLDIFKEILTGLAELIRAIRSNFEIFQGEGVSSLEIFANALRLVSVALIAFRIGFESVANIIVSGLAYVVLYFKTFGEVAFKVLMYDFSGAARAWKSGMQQLATEVKAGLDRAKEIALKGRKDLDDALTKPLGLQKPITPAGEVGKQGTKTQGDLKNKAGELAKARLAEETAAAKAELAMLEELNREQEAELADRYRNNLITIKDFYAQELELARELADAKILEKGRELEAAKKVASIETDPTKRIEANAKVVEVEGQLKVLQAQRAEAFVKNSREMQNAEQQLANQLAVTRLELQQALGTKQIDVERANVRQRAALNQISAEQEIQEYRALQEAKYKLDLQTIQKRRELQNLSVSEREKLAADELKLHAEHNASMLELDRQMELERKRLALDAQAAITEAFNKFVQDVANGTKSIKSSWLSLVSSVQQAITKMMSDSLVKQFLGGGTQGGNLMGGLLGKLVGLMGGTGGSNASVPSFEGAGAGFGGALADGGSVAAGKAYFVGERGPELFVPKSAGTIMPSGSGGSSVSVHNVFNLNTPMDMRTQQQIAAITARAVQEASRRNN